MVGPGAENFAIDMELGVITTTAVLDHETVQSFPDLAVIIFDEGNLESNASLLVIVADLNDNSPIFSSSGDSVAIREGTPISSEIFSASATDSDSTSNSLLTYSFGEPSSLDFSINQASGAVSVARALDYESVTRYVLEIIASDNGMPSRNSSFFLTVNVADDNDNAPVVSDLGPINLTENVSPGTVVGVISATDADSGTNADLIYEIVAGNEAQKFAINQAMGVIFTTGTIDREEIDSYAITVEVQINIYMNNFFF